MSFCFARRKVHGSPDTGLVMRRGWGVISFASQKLSTQTFLGCVSVPGGEITHATLRQPLLPA
jgi:hypothetical protein